MEPSLDTQKSHNQLGCDIAEALGLDTVGLRGFTLKFTHDSLVELKSYYLPPNVGIGIAAYVLRSYALTIREVDNTVSDE